MVLNLVYTKQQQDIFFNSTQKYVIVKKGRRFGATQGAAQASVEWCVEGKKILWGDTISSNIDRYVERFFLSVLKKNNIPYVWNVQKKELKILNGYVDFRSADRPENWEGFGYDKVILNEAGIILKNPYLYTNAVLPMLIDYEGSQLFALGVPKGKTLKNGTDHPFWKLIQRGQNGHVDYRVMTFSSYENPFLNAEDIKALEHEIGAMSPEMIKQEIYGEVIDATAGNPFAHKFDEQRHVSERAVLRPEKQLLIMLDFNLVPFCAIFGHKWVDAEGEHFHIIDEISIDKGSIPEMADQIMARYARLLYNCTLTGDKMGDKGDISQRDLATLYVQIQRALRLSNGQIVTPANPLHKNSRADVNYVLTYLDDFAIHPKCKGLIYDMKMVEVDAFEKIIKANRKNESQRADYLDCLRYGVNTYLHRWIRFHQKTNNVLKISK